MGRHRVSAWSIVTAAPRTQIENHEVVGMTQKKLRVLLAEGGSCGTAAALHALYPERESKLELTIVSTIATLLPTIKVVDPEVILRDLSLSLRESAGCCASGPSH